MKPHDDQSEKTSRRHFVRTVATTLVAAPVISSLSACSQPAAPTPTTTESPTPTATTKGTTGQKGPFIITGNRPPVIIDGGSLHIASAVKLVNDTTGPTERPYVHSQSTTTTDPKYRPTYGHAEWFRITNDYGECPPLWEEVVDGKELTIKIWLEPGTINTDGSIAYPGRVPLEPQFIFNDKPGATPTAEPKSFLIEYVDAISSSPEEQVKGDRLGAKYKKIDVVVPGVGRKPFRIRQVQALVNLTSVYDSGRPQPSNEHLAKNGFRIIIALKEYPPVVP